ncbi:hypothetical protein Moror_7536 [Moniliophthora roreri MCA 2997]|uniref:Uncharacterized protein n=2 Tax=Moniliophthora roreri TaxID=221103 RepID=V2XWZ7_MONRO|nr:hypothetical protein Moror_7536 [Moniliophthora roreri MCA 2997]KAI3609861.1 hypothetical protein WG66_007581 [Moniliophthora roreri]
MVLSKPSLRVPTSYTLKDARQHPYPRPLFEDDDIDHLYAPHPSNDSLVDFILEAEQRRVDHDTRDHDEVNEGEADGKDDFPVLSLILLELILLALIFLKRALIMGFLMRFINEEE